jgi:UDPglucose 6-dehydrogenase
MKFIIAGYGFVGSSIGKLLSQQHEVIPVDPRLNNNKIEDHIHTADGLIIAVSTPPLPNGNCDTSNIDNVMGQVVWPSDTKANFPPTLPILIKSTVPWTELERWENYQITLYPEFLREATALEDFINQKYLILGGKKPQFWADILRNSLPLVKHIHTCTVQEASIVKYFANSFLATKLTFFNELFELCEKTDADYDTVSNLLGLDPRIGKGHTDVPGSDGKFGWGGHCFPKDTQALLNVAKSLDVKLTLLEESIGLNKKHREKT